MVFFIKLNFVHMIYVNGIIKDQTKIVEDPSRCFFCIAAIGRGRGKKWVCQLRDSSKLSMYK